MFAVIETGGKQYMVNEGDEIRCEKISGDRGDEVIFDKVLLASDGNEVKIGSPYLQNVRVKGRILSHGKGKKIIVFKYKRRKGYKRKRGHRQQFTQVKIEEIVVNG